jgi:hypothetical protein
MPWFLFLCLALFRVFRAFRGQFVTEAGSVNSTWLGGPATEKKFDKTTNGFKIKTVLLHLNQRKETDHVDLKIQNSPGIPLQRGLPYVARRVKAAGAL